MCVCIYIYTYTHTQIHIYVCVCVYTHTHLTVYRLYINYRCYQIILQCNIVIQIGRGEKCWLDIYHSEAGLAVSGPIADIGQKILQYYFQTWSSNSPSYFQIFLLNAFREKSFIRNTITVNHTTSFYGLNFSPICQTHIRNYVRV